MEGAQRALETGEVPAGLTRQTLMVAKWITIEYSNSKCAPLEETSSGREFVIPESGYLCTSSAMYMGWHREKFYAVDERNSRTPIEVDKRILRPESFNVNEPSLDAGMPACKVTVE